MNQDTHGSNAEEWIGFDLDGTLAKYDGWKGIEHIGEPVASMVVIAKMLHRLGKKIKILTARVAPRDDGKGGEEAKKYVEAWCKKNLGFIPEITYEKDASMAALFDDRAVAVEQNTGKVLGGWPDFLPKASDKAKNAVLRSIEKKADAHHPDFAHVIQQFKDKYGIDLSHVKLRYSKHPRYSNGKRSYDFEDDETGGSHGHVGDDSVVWLNPNLRPVMDRFDVPGSVKDFRRWMIAHELAHEIDCTMKKKRFVKKMLNQAGKENFHTGYLDTVPEHKMDKEIFAEYMAHLLQEKKADSRPSKEDLWRMYDIMQADARLSKKVRGLGFGRSGDAYRRAAVKLRIMELAKVVRDGRRTRNDIVHTPGYVPSRDDADRALKQYADADKKLSELISHGR